MMADEILSRTPSTAGDVDVSILVVSYNTREMTLACIESIRRETSQASYEIIVWDNDSHDGTCEAIEAAFPDTLLVRSRENIGFGPANNRAAALARGRRFLLLNPDTVVLDQGVDRLIEFADRHPSNGIWGGRHLRADHSLHSMNCWADHSIWSIFCQATGLSRAFKNSDFFNPREYPSYDRLAVKEVDIVTGCFLLIDRDLWEKLGGMDDSFFLFGEEVDLCRRARADGAQPIVDPRSIIIHYGGGSTTSGSIDRQIHLMRAERQLVRKHFGRNAARISCALLDTGVALRATVGEMKRLVRRESRSNLWLEMLRRRQEWA